MENILQDDFNTSIRRVVSCLKISNVEKYLEEIFDMPSAAESVEYLGNLNKSDLMF